MNGQKAIGDRRKDDGRRARLAKVHIAKKQLGLDDDLYHMILQEEFGVESSAHLSNGELDRLLERFRLKGWKEKSPQPPFVKGGQGGISPLCQRGAQVEALRERIGQVILHSDLTPKRYRGLLFKVCGVTDLQWCDDAGKLKRVLVILTRICKGGTCSN